MNFFPDDYAERRAHYLDGITAQAMRDASAVVAVRERLRKLDCHEMLSKRALRVTLVNCKRAVIEIADRIITNATPRTP